MSFDYWQSLDYDCHYHIYNRAVGDSVLFKDHSDYILFLKKYKEYCNPYFKTLAYCLIPNHFHFIVRVRSEEEIEEQILSESSSAAEKLSSESISINDFLVNQLKRLFSSYANSYNRKYNRTGPVFQRKVKRVFINNDDRIRYLIGYVHHNPIHHRMSKDYTVWRYSSFNSLISEKQTEMDKTAVFELFGGRDGFHHFHTKFKIMKREEP